MHSSAIDSLADKFNNAVVLTELEHKYVRDSNKYNYIHFNGEIFKNGFKGNQCSFIVNNYEKKVLINLKENWKLEANKIGENLFNCIRYKLSYHYRKFFEPNDTYLKIRSNEEIVHYIIKDFLSKMHDKMATEEEILNELKRYFPARQYVFKNIMNEYLFPRLCAGKNSSKKYNYFYNDGSIDDIALIDRKMSMSKYIDFLVSGYENNISLIEVSRHYFLMYNAFKVHRLVLNWHEKFGYDLKFEIKGDKTNLIFEKHVYTLLENAFHNKDDYFIISNRMHDLYKNNALLWLMMNVFKFDKLEDSSIRFRLKYNLDEDIITFYGQTNLIMLIPYIFKKLFFELQGLICVGSDYKYTFNRYKNIYNLKHELL